MEKFLAACKAMGVPESAYVVLSVDAADIKVEMPIRLSTLREEHERNRIY